MARAAVSLLALAAVAQALPRQAITQRETAPFTREGCFVDNEGNKRALGGKSYSDDAMTVESCAAYCSKSKYFASAPCRAAATPTPKCGAGGRLDVYLNNLYVAPKPATLEAPYLGCFVDQGARTLPDNLLGDDTMTTQKCAAHCANFSYFGVEYGRECWCGNSPPKTPAPASECSFTCAGDDTQLCGAGGRINVWGAPLPSPATVGDFEYAGCFTDKGDQHSLTGKVTYDSSMTLEKCAAICSAYSYFGVEFASQCFCGTELEASAEERPQAECSLRCGGDYNNVCGDADRLNVFVSAECKDEPENVPTVAGFTYKSCWADDYFGVEYGNECFCGNEIAGQAAPEAQCSYICEGNALEWCGAAERLNVYSAAVVPQ
ncbi:hypothetical protein N0V88_006697 [Collariella sp. IMI 366227]|nr:hypothetical protein N0V88_006697 [Collariella sp. IMI 366227]